MTRPVSLLLALMLAFAPRLGEADGIPGYGLVTPAKPPIQGFASLFQSPPSRIVGNRPTMPASNAAAAAAAPSAGFSNLAGTFAAGAICRPALVAAEARHGIPTGLLQAIGSVESGRRDEVTGRREPWPWTINAEGEPRFFETKQEAVTWVRLAQARGVQSIDVGCAQVNLMHHPSAFVSLEQAFDPAANADYAARFLKELWDTTAGRNWMTAAGQYHSQTPELADTYRQQVQAAMTHGTLSIAPVPTLASAFDPVPPFARAGPARSVGGARPEPGRLLPAPSGTVGRGLNAYRAAPIQMAAATRPAPSRVQAILPASKP